MTAGCSQPLKFPEISLLPLPSSDGKDPGEDAEVLEGA